MVTLFIMRLSLSLSLSLSLYVCVFGLVCLCARLSMCAVDHNEHSSTHTRRQTDKQTKRGNQYDLSTILILSEALTMLKA